MANRFRKLRIESMEARQLMAVTTFGTLDGVSLIQQPEESLAVVSEEIGSPSEPMAPVLPSGNVVALNSLPGAPASLYLDFDGHLQVEETGDLGSNIRTPAFNRDFDPSTFSDFEQEEIQRIWSMVAEDYAPFNINVTTIEPTGTQPFMRVVISGDKDFRGSNKLGTAYVEAYSDSDEPNIAYVFTKYDGRPGSGNEIADAISHEAGHAFGLQHYGNTIGNDLVSPLMRENVRDTERSVWWGNDMSVIASSMNGFGYRPDDHGDFISGVTSMTTDNNKLVASGIIENHLDTDIFRFETGGGVVTIDLIVQPAYVANLNADFLLYDSKGAWIAFDSPPNSLGAKLTKDLSAGTYYFAVQSDGQYGDVGQYSLEVNENSGAHVVSSQFQTLSSTQMGLLVTFNEPINAFTFTAADVRINGGIIGAGVAGVQQISDRQFLVIMNASANHGLNVTVGPDIVDMFGNKMNQDNAGLNGEASDSYSATRFPTGNLWTVGTDLTTSPTKPAKGKLSLFAVDAYFRTY